MKHTLLTCYYLLLALAIGVKVADTVYKGSLTISQAQVLDELRSQKAVLEKDVQANQSLLAHQTAVTTVATTARTQGFEKIASPIVITDITTLAQR